MRARLFVVTASAFIGVAIGMALWRFWTPRCNELCPTWIALGMIGTAVLMPAVGALAVGLAMRPNRTPVWRRRASVGVLAMVSAIVLALTWATCSIK